VAKKRVEDAEAVVQQKPDDMMHAEILGLTSKVSETTFEVMVVAIGASLSDLASSNDGEDGEDEDDDESGWVMGTITITVQQPMMRFRQKQMKVK
jgi:hypothetical protein